jgi:hypothetical protein
VVITILTFVRSNTPFWGFHGKVNIFALQFYLLTFPPPPSFFRNACEKWSNIDVKIQIKIVMYLDDGFGMAQNFEDCINHSQFVKNSLTKAGFLINEKKKSIFTPVSELEWLGILWNACEFSIKIPDRRIIDLKVSIEETVKCFATVTARKLAQCVGRIISMSPVVGNSTRLMTRHCYTCICIESRSTWDSRLVTGYKDEIFNELNFWSKNINSLSTKRLDLYSKSSVIVFSDASSVACGACTVELDKKIFHQMWDNTEACKNST